MSCSSTNLVLVGLDLFGYWQETSAYRKKVYLLPKQLDEQVSALHIPALGTVLAVFAVERQDQQNEVYILPEAQ